MEFVVAGVEGCGWCAKALEMVEGKVAKFIFDSFGEYHDFVENFEPAWRTAPAIWRESVPNRYVFVGGYAELEHLLRSRV